MKVLSVILMASLTVIIHAAEHRDSVLEPPAADGGSRGQPDIVSSSAKGLYCRPHVFCPNPIYRSDGRAVCPAGCPYSEADGLCVCGYDYDDTRDRLSLHCPYYCTYSTLYRRCLCRGLRQ